MPRGVGPAALAGLCALCSGAWAQEPLLEDLRGLSIEQLSNLEITSVSRRPEALSQAPAAIEVITSEEIVRSGAQSLPEVLRLARNLEVARVSSQHYAITARGFNTFQASNKLLVLIDGRSIYTPLYSGVLWDQHHVTLDDIDRIEVISGPGGTLWGANAVNGVINIVTRSASETQGVLAHAFVGAADQRFDLRYGGRLADSDVSYRVFANVVERGSLLTTSGDRAGDDWGVAQVGFRADWGDARDAYMLQGAAHHRTDSDSDNRGGRLLARWRRALADGSALAAQAYISSAEAAEGGVSDALLTGDVEVQHSMILGPHEIVWGGGYRVSQSEFINSTSPSGLVEARRTLRTANAFIQDEIALRDNLDLTLGLKIEDHTFTGVEYMPSVRVAWRPTDDSLVWGAVSRAVRTPSRIDRELVNPGVITPGGFDSEYLVAYELGYRMQPTSNSTLSANLYYHDYEDVRTVNLTPPGVLPARIGNGLEGEVYGLELWGDVDMTPDWRLSAGVTLMEWDFRAEPLAIDFNGTGDDPGYQVFLRSYLNLAEDWTLDFDVRAIDEVRPDIPAYVELGARIGWRINDNVEIALTGRNLLDEAHPESFDEGILLETRRDVQLSARVTY